MGIENIRTDLSGEKLHIAILGRKDVGKSSLLSRIIKKEIFVEDEKVTGSFSRQVELIHNGPILTVNMAGIEDLEETEKKKIGRTIKELSKADFVILVLDAREQLYKSETALIACLQKIKVPFIITVNKVEFGINPHLLTELVALELRHFEISCKENAGIENLVKKIVHLLPGETELPLINDLVGQGDVVLLVGQIDYDLTKDGITKSQIKVIKEALDKDTICVVVKDRELRNTLSLLKNPPDLVISESQIIKTVSAIVPANVMLTTFSILRARYNENLAEYIKGLKSIDELKNGDKILISEACTNHAKAKGIEILKVTKWLEEHTAKKLDFKFISDQDFPDNIREYKLLIHCNGCMLTRKTMHVRIKQARLMDIPIINYSLLITYLHGSIPRVLLPFKEAFAEWEHINAS